jgi:MurNAc alpha-1-phosphate uridylyltransferase
MLREAGGEKLVYGNIALHDTALFAELKPHTRIKLLPLWQQWIARGQVSGERYDGGWMNVGTPDDLAQLDAALRQRDRPAT